MPVLILCGGLATRLYPMSETMPKSLIKIHGKPFIEYQLDQLNQNHVTDVVLCVGVFGDAIKQCVGNKYKNISIQYSYDGDISLGTGGAIKKALYLLPDDFIILYGDSYLQVSLNKMINKYKVSKKPILMSVYRNRNKSYKNNIIYDGEILYYNKETPSIHMEHIDYGVSILNKSIFDSYPDTFDLSDLFTDFADKKQVASIEMMIPFYEVGSFKGIERFKKRIGK